MIENSLEWDTYDGNAKCVLRAWWMLSPYINSVVPYYVSVAPLIVIVSVSICILPPGIKTHFACAS